MRRIISRDAEEMKSESRAEMVNSLNEVCEKNGYLVPVIVAGVFFTLLFATQAPNPIPAIVVGLIMVVASWGAGRADTSRKNVVFAYELEGRE